MILECYSLVSKEQIFFAFYHDKTFKISYIFHKAVVILVARI